MIAVDLVVGCVVNNKSEELHVMVRMRCYRVIGEVLFFFF